MKKIPMKKILLLFLIFSFTSCAVKTSLLEKYKYPEELKEQLNSDEVMTTKDAMVLGSKSFRYGVNEIIPKLKENQKLEDKSLKRQTRKKLKSKLDSLNGIVFFYNKKIINGRNNKKNREFYSEMNRFLEKKKKKGFKSTDEYQEWESHRKTKKRLRFNYKKYIEYYANINWNEKSDTFIQAERYQAYRRFYRLRTLTSILYTELILLLII